MRNATFALLLSMVFALLFCTTPAFADDPENSGLYGDDVDNALCLAIESGADSADLSAFGVSIDRANGRRVLSDFQDDFFFEHSDRSFLIRSLEFRLNGSQVTSVGLVYTEADPEVRAQMVVQLDGRIDEIIASSAQIPDEEERLGAICEEIWSSAGPDFDSTAEHGSDAYSLVSGYANRYGLASAWQACLTRLGYEGSYYLDTTNVGIYNKTLMDGVWRYTNLAWNQSRQNNTYFLTSLTERAGRYSAMGLAAGASSYEPVSLFSDNWYLDETNEMSRYIASEVAEGASEIDPPFDVLSNYRGSDNGYCTRLEHEYPACGMLVRSFSYSFSANDKRMHISVDYKEADAAVRQKMLEDYAARRDFITDKARALSEPVAQVALVHNYLLKEGYYDEYFEDMTKTGHAHDAYGCLVQGICVCEGFATAFHDIMNQLGIESKTVSDVGHIWNRVKIDGQWKIVDVTYDLGFAPQGSVTEFSDRYFLVNSHTQNDGNVALTPYRFVLDESVSMDSPVVYELLQAISRREADVEFENPAVCSTIYPQFEMKWCPYAMSLIYPYAMIDVTSISFTAENGLLTGAHLTYRNTPLASAYQDYMDNCLAQSQAISSKRGQADHILARVLSDFGANSPYSSDTVESAVASGKLSPQNAVKLAGDAFNRLGIPYSILTSNKSTYYFKFNFNGDDTYVPVRVGKGLTVMDEHPQDIGEYATPLFFDFGSELADTAVLAIDDPEPAMALSSATVQGLSDVPYRTGGAFPELSLANGEGKPMEEGTDYVLSYADNDHVGEATVTITGLGAYYGSVTETFNIVQRDISSENLQVEVGDFSAIDDTLSVALADGTPLVAHTDFLYMYSFSYRSLNIEITGLWNYGGKQTVSIPVDAPSLSDGGFIDGVYRKSYTGNPIVQDDISVGHADDYGFAELVEGRDYVLSYKNNVEVGTATVTATGIGDYVGEVSEDFQIATAPISNATVLYEDAYPLVNGKATPHPVVTLGGHLLVEGDDYTISYLNNTKVGRGLGILQGKKNLMNTLQTTFTISSSATSTKKQISEATLSGLEDSYLFEGAAIVPSIELYDAGTKLSENTDYLVALRNNASVGAGRLVVAGIGEYAGVIDTTFPIVSEMISDARAASIQPLVFTGEELAPSVEIYKNGNLLSEHVDYELSYSDNIYPGIAKATARGIGNYGGTLDIGFEILPLDLSEGQLEVVGSYTYSHGDRIIPTVHVSMGERMVPPFCYELSLTRNIDAGIAQVQVTGRNGCTGSLVQNFRIAPMDIEQASIEGLQRAYAPDAVPEFSVKLDGAQLEEGTDYSVSYASDILPGKVVMTVSGIGNYTGSIASTFEVLLENDDPESPVYIGEQAEISGIPDSAAYTGSPIEFEPVVSFDGNVLVPGIDYMVDFFDNTDAGEALCVVQGIGSYYGEAQKTFTITPLPLESANISLSESSFVYDGQAKEPQALVELGGRELACERDFHMSYSDNVEPGQAKAIVEGIGNYEGSFELPFTISPRDIGPVTVSGIEASYAYTMGAITPKVLLTYGEQHLIQNIDYTATYKNNVNVGTATVTLSGKGRYTGALERTFDITQRPISEASATDIEAKTYTGKAITPELSVTYSNNTLVSGRDYTVSYNNNVQTGTASVTLTGAGGFSGTLTKTFAIVPAGLSQAQFSACGPNAYTGKKLFPEPSVQLNGTVLVKDTDYTLSYKDNVNVGTATITCTGKGNYTATATTTFKIVGRNISQATFSTVANQYYTGNAVKPSITAKYNDTTLKNGTDYTLSYKNNIKIGTATVTVTGKGNFAGTKAMTFKIVRTPISRATLSNMASSYYYTGKGITPAPVLKWGGRTLGKGTDFTLSYKDNTAITTTTPAKITVTGKGNFTGTKDITFKIVRTPISKVSLSNIADTYYYTGTNRIPAPVLKWGGRTLVKGTDYAVSYKNNVKLGTATLTVTGKGKFTGSRTKTFKIVRTPISKVALSNIAKSYKYTGSNIKPAPVLKWGGRTLKQGTDYTVAYSNNKQKGTATVVITGKGNFTGSAKRTFSIK